MAARRGSGRALADRLDEAYREWRSCLSAGNEGRRADRYQDVLLLATEFARTTQAGTLLRTHDSRDQIECISTDVLYRIFVPTAEKPIRYKDKDGRNFSGFFAVALYNRVLTYLDANALALGYNPVGSVTRLQIAAKKAGVELKLRNLDRILPQLALSGNPMTREEAKEALREGFTSWRIEAHRADDEGDGGGILEEAVADPTVPREEDLLHDLALDGFEAEMKERITRLHLNREDRRTVLLATLRMLMDSLRAEGEDLCFDYRFLPAGVRVRVKPANYSRIKEVFLDLAQEVYARRFPDGHPLPAGAGKAGKRGAPADRASQDAVHLPESTQLMEG